MDAQAVSVLSKNLAGLFSSEQYEVRREDFRRSLPCLFADEKKFDLVLADPPYRQDFLDELSSVWGKYPALHPDGLMALEHSKKQHFDAPENLALVESRRYGDTMISYFKAPG
jgi:16S rRNA G966 N2-methylase RsmD